MFFSSVIMVSQITFAQQVTSPENNAAAAIGQPPKSRTKAAANDATPKAAKLTPDQILGNQTLEMAESQARGLGAAMRSYSLLQIAEAFTASNSAKARGLLQDAFSASLAIQDDDLSKSALQEDIFRALLPISQSDVEEQLARAEPRAPSRQPIASLRVTPRRSSLIKQLT
jgi:hypothetical protein